MVSDRMKRMHNVNIRIANKQCQIKTTHTPVSPNGGDKYSQNQLWVDFNSFENERDGMAICGDDEFTNSV